MARTSISEYKAAAGSQFTQEDAEIIGPVIERLAMKGHSTAPEIVNAARPLESPLHPYFEWNDGEAAELYRHNQAREMTRAIVVVRRTHEDEPAQEVRAFFPVHRDPEAKQGRKPREYVHIDSIMADPALSEQVVTDALKMLRAWRNRFDVYRTIFPSEWSPVFEVVEEITEKIEVAA